MKKRKLLAVVGLTIITLGIYDIFWLVKTKKELNAKTKTHVPSIWLLFLPLLLFIAALIAFIVSIASTSSSVNTSSTYSFSANNITSGEFNGTTTTSNTASGATIFIVLYILAIILWFSLSFYWFLKFSKAIDEYTNGKMSKGETFLLLWVLHLFGVLLIQDAFNDMIDSGAMPDKTDLKPDTPTPIAPVAPPDNSQVSAPAPIQPAVISPAANPAPADMPAQPAIVVSPSMPGEATQASPQGPLIQ